MISRVGMFDSTYAEIPKRFEAGTPNIAEAVGLAAAIDYLEALGMDNVQRHDELLTQRVLARFGEVPEVTLYGPHGSAQAPRGALVSFTLAGVHAHDLATLLDDRGIAIRSGHHCAQPLGKYLAVPATARASFYVYNDLDEVDELVDALIEIRDHFGALA